MWCGKEEEEKPYVWLEAVLLCFFAGRNRSALASRCMVETLLEMWRTGVTYQQVQVRPIGAFSWLEINAVVTCLSVEGWYGYGTSRFADNWGCNQKTVNDLVLDSPLVFLILSGVPVSTLKVL